MKGFTSGKPFRLLYIPDRVSQKLSNHRKAENNPPYEVKLVRYDDQYHPFLRTT